MCLPWKKHETCKRCQHVLKKGSLFTIVVVDHHQHSFNVYRRVERLCGECRPTWDAKFFGEEMKLKTFHTNNGKTEDHVYVPLESRIPPPEWYNMGSLYWEKKLAEIEERRLYAQTQFDYQYSKEEILSRPDSLG